MKRHLSREAWFRGWTLVVLVCVLATMNAILGYQVGALSAPGAVAVAAGFQAVFIGGFFAAEYSSTVSDKIDFSGVEFATDD